MTPAQYNAFCRNLPHTTYVMQWGGAHVWKVAGKVFAIAWDEPGELHVTFKVSDLSYDLMKEQPGLRPAPYLASRGMKWIQRTDTQTLDDAGLRDYIAGSHRIVASGLPKKTQRELGIGDEAEPKDAKRQAPPRKPGARSTRTTQRQNSSRGAER
jgi:predicted DNA-binding protein (MmcQ/YjbR family)